MQNAGQKLAAVEPTVLMKAVNALLCRQQGGSSKKGAIAVSLVGVKAVPALFHSRYCASGRSYHYRLVVAGEEGAPPLSVFERGRAWGVPFTRPKPKPSRKHPPPRNYETQHVNNDPTSTDDDESRSPRFFNVDAMREAATHLVGTHDFSGLRAPGCQASSPIRTIDHISIHETRESPHDAWLMYPWGFEAGPYPHLPVGLPSREPRPFPVDDPRHPAPNSTSSSLFPPPRGTTTIETTDEGELRELVARRRPRRQHILVTVRSRAFLHHQVRLLVGLLRAVGEGRVRPDEIPALLAQKSFAATVQRAPMAPPDGLYLAGVHYESYDGTLPPHPATYASDIEEDSGSDEEIETKMEQDQVEEERKRPRRE